MELNLRAELRQGETTDQALARVATTPECLSASVLTICQNIDHSQITEMVGELSHQTIALRKGDMSRVESMLLAQAHTLDGLFAKLATKALTAGHIDILESYMRLALKAQNQARATLQTLGDIKSPRQVAFVQQANIGNQVQVNNGAKDIFPRPRAGKTKKALNELLEVVNGERLDTRAAGSAGPIDPAMATLDEKHRTENL